MVFEERIQKGEESEVKFRKYMENKGFTVCFVSQHRDNPSSKLSRHFPDFFVIEIASFVQVKNGSASEKYKNVIAQRDSLKACQELKEHGNKVLVVWEMPDGNFMGNNIENLDLIGEISKEARLNGSGTPAVKVAKSSLKPV